MTQQGKPPRGCPRYDLQIIRGSRKVDQALPVAIMAGHGWASEEDSTLQCVRNQVATLEML